ncbi:hypothetical protein, partial [Actinoplanes palleronii]|uniref:hypothetical protein n=1 Tax=Actinoplanes palleronii TaxID=113570 RepID=UPI001941EFE4
INSSSVTLGQVQLALAALNPGRQRAETLTGRFQQALVAAVVATTDARGPKPAAVIAALPALIQPPVLAG